MLPASSQPATLPLAKPWRWDLAKILLLQRTASLTIRAEIHELEGHGNVTRPGRPPRKHHLSELIDPDDLPPNLHMRTRSGNVLGREEWVAHPDRPRSLRERREEVMRRVAERAAQANAEAAGDGVAGAGAGEEALVGMPYEEMVEGEAPAVDGEVDGGVKKKWWRRLMCW